MIWYSACSIGTEYCYRFISIQLLYWVSSFSAGVCHAVAAGCTCHATQWFYWELVDALWKQTCLSILWHSLRSSWPKETRPTCVNRSHGKCFRSSRSLCGRCGLGPHWVCWRWGGGRKMVNRKGDLHNTWGGHPEHVVSSGAIPAAWGMCLQLRQLLVDLLLIPLFKSDGGPHITVSRIWHTDTPPARCFCDLFLMPNH